MLPVRAAKPAASSYVARAPGHTRGQGLPSADGLVHERRRRGQRAQLLRCPSTPRLHRRGQGACPKCGMKLVPSEAPLPASHENAVHGHEQHDEPSDGLEWEDLMPEINRASEPSNMRWMLIDGETGAENGAITWAFTVGDRVKIRLVNEMESDHPMHHPFHVHGAGRFLVLSRDGQAESNLVWKDTVLVRAGQTVDIVLDVSNPGLWMAPATSLSTLRRDDVQLRRVPAQPIGGCPRDGTR